MNQYPTDSTQFTSYCESQIDSLRCAIEKTTYVKEPSWYLPKE